VHQKPLAVLLTEELTDKLTEVLKKKFLI